MARLASMGIIILFFVLLMLQLASTKRQLQRAWELDKTYITFSELDIDKDEYYPGDIVGFKYTRYAQREGTYPVVYISIDCFENIDTGEIFPGITGARIVKESGETVRHGLRKLPDFATPGRYKIEGSVISQTNRLTAAQAYTSEAFVVKPRSAGSKPKGGPEDTPTPSQPVAP